MICITILGKIRQWISIQAGIPTQLWKWHRKQCAALLTVMTMSMSIRG